MQSLGSLGGAAYTEALGINNSGQVVGTSETSLGARAFLWTKASGMQDLNSLIPVTQDVLLAQAVHINNRGQILALGSIHHDLTRDREADLEDEMHAGPVHVFLITPGKLLSSDSIAPPASEVWRLAIGTGVSLLQQ